MIAPKNFNRSLLAVLATGCLIAVGITPRPLQAQTPKYHLADLEVKTLAAEPGRYFGRCALERVADGSWFLVYHESGSHFKYEPAEPKPILSGVLHARFSTDGGRTWSQEDHCHDGTPIAGFPAYPPGAEPTSGRFEPSEPWTYLAPNGDLVVHSLKKLDLRADINDPADSESHRRRKTVPSDQKIDYVELPAENLDSIESFYSSTFGWSFTDYGPKYRAFSDGKLDGGFFKSELQSSTATGAALIVLFAHDLEATKDKVVANGGSVCKEIFSFPGGRRFHFLDPHGNELAVWSDK